MFLIVCLFLVPFLHPLILVSGLLAIGVPILIHLLMRRRRQVVMWGAMRFVMEAYRKTQRRLLLQRWLLLATRCLLLAALAVVLARPLMGGSAGAGRGGRTLHLVVDDSIASGVRRDGGSALDAQRTLAIKLIDTLGEGDRVSLFGAGGPASPLVWPASSNLSGVREVLRGLRSNDSAADLRSPLSTISASVDPTAPDAGRTTHTVCLLSEFSSGALDLRGAPPKLGPGVRVLASAPASFAGGNVGIASVTSSRSVLFAGDAAGASTITVTLVRSGSIVNEAGASDVRLALDGLGGSGAAGDAALGGGRVRWAAGQRIATLAVAVDDLARLASGQSTPIVRASIDGDALSADNAFRLPLSSKTALRVGLVGEPPVASRSGAGGSPGDAFSPMQWIAAALRPTDSGGIELEEIDALGLDTPRLARLDALVITTPDRLDIAAWGRVNNFIRAGGLLIFTPTAGLASHEWVDTLRRALPVGWTIDVGVSDLSTVTTPARVSPAGPSDDPADPSDLLGSVRREMDDLTRSVTVTRMLKATVTRAEGEGRASDGMPGAASASVTGASAGATVLLRLASGEPLVISGGLASASVAPGAVGTSGASTGAGDQGGEGAGTGENSGAPGAGQVVYIATALSAAWTDLPSKPLMVPLMQELVRQGVSRSRPAQWSVAGLSPTLPSGAKELRSLMAREAPPDALALTSPSIDPSGRLVDALRDSAVYDLISARGQSMGRLAVNPDASGARLDAPERAALVAWLGSALSDPGAQPVLIDPAGGAPGAGGPVSAERAMAMLSERAERAASGPLWLWIVLALAGAELLLARLASISGGSMKSGAGGAGGGRGAREVAPASGASAPEASQ